MENSKLEILERIINKMNTKVEEILAKEEIDYNDFMILSTNLNDLKNDIASEKMAKLSEIFSPIK